MGRGRIHRESWKEKVYGRSGEHEGEGLSVGESQRRVKRSSRPPVRIQSKG